MHLLTLIKIAHLMGLVMGLGGALLLDFTILTRGIIKPVSHYTIHQLHLLSRAVSLGLIVLWVTGIALIWLNWQIKPDYIENPKLWAKIIIVMILTLNGILIHAAVMPHLEKRLGHRLFDGKPNSQIMMFTFVASLSAVSWFTPFVLGKASELNFVVPATTILFAYCCAVVFMWGGMLVLTSGITSIQANVRQEYEGAMPSNSYGDSYGDSFGAPPRSPYPAQASLLIVEQSGFRTPRHVPNAVRSNWLANPEVVATRAEFQSRHKLRAA